MQHASFPSFEDAASPLASYQEMIGLVERLHRLMLDVIKDEFERLGILEVNAVQALLLFNVGDQELTAGELRSRGYYQGSNVSYNLKKLVELGYMVHARCEVDRRSVRVRLTERGLDIRDMVAALLSRHAGEIAASNRLQGQGLASLVDQLREVERFWAERIRFIY
ncbi:MAG: MarR family winged helix-turn-helix transcriptional regulator [Rubricella sp.]